ncbi:MAG: hypothetical protein E5V89_09785 [Mesorhizobium sp.]|nr:MAG: hypothetical protein E5V89_09785 [Mesorhizobium sp.]
MLKKITASADGGALPAANMTRRAALGALASLPAVAGATALPVALEASTTISDPLADAINAYYTGMAYFAAIPSELIDRENEEDFVQATYGPAFDRLWKDCPPATSLHGVAEAIRYALGSDSITSGSAENTLQAALAYLDREVQQS